MQTYSRHFRQGVFTQAILLGLLWLLPQAEIRAHDHEGGEKKEDHGHEAGGHVELTPEVMDDLGVKIVPVKPAGIRLTVSLNGRLTPHENQVAHVIPRYPGILREVRKQLGDSVQKGEAVAVVESNQNLQAYEVRSSLAGQVVRRHAVVGEFVGETSELFEIADYGQLFADLFVFPTDAAKIRLGQKVMIRFPGVSQAAESTISFISPVTDPDTQSRFARAVLENPGGVYQPGMFVTGLVVLDEFTVPVAVERSALRTNEGKPTVFVREGKHLEPRAVRVGRQDDDTVEIVDGLRVGEEYAAGNTFILQAELEKGEAEHDH